MNTIAEVSSSRCNRSYAQTPGSRILRDVGASTVTTIPPVLKHPHDNSVNSFEHHPRQSPSQSEENLDQFTRKLLKNKSLLVPTRLALKRQRATLQPSTRRLEPLYSDTVQMELGNPDEYLMHNVSTDDEDLKAIMSENLPSPPEQYRTQSISNQSSPIREETPHTLPADISLLYREKPLFSHPVTGHFIVQYAEETGSPSPCSYVLPRKSCREKNAPAYTFGSRCLVEKKGGSRTGWQKQWFAHSDPFTTKVDFHREKIWPTPFHYPAKTSLGNQTTKTSSPAWSMGVRFPSNSTVNSENNPSPDAYDTDTAFRKLVAKTTQITLKSRPGGTQLSTNQNKGTIPGPNAYDEKKFLSNKSSAPKHSFGKRIPTSLGQDPYVNVLPSIGPLLD